MNFTDDLHRKTLAFYERLRESNDLPDPSVVVPNSVVLKLNGDKAPTVMRLDVYVTLPDGLLD
jgi:hypothetical protein